MKIPEPQKVRLTDLNFAVYNPRVMPLEKMAALKASLEKHGLVLNLVVQKKGMVIIGGHQRVRAVRELCAENGTPEPEFAWATVLDVDDREARQLNISLNNVEGEFDTFKLGELFSDLLPTMSDEDVLATGFMHDNIEELVRMVGSPDEMAADIEAGISDELDRAPSQFLLTIEFETREERDEARKILVERTTKKKPGSVVLEALKKRGQQAR